MSEWQPIETAPKDGTHILAFAYPLAIIPLVCCWQQAPEGIRDQCKEWQWKWSEADDFFRDDDLFRYWIEMEYNPTHWMPLPPPPTTGQDGE